MKYLYCGDNLHVLRLVLAIALLPLVAHSTVVTTLTDEDDGSLGGGSGISLREAVTYSAPGDTVTFAPDLSGQTIRCTAGQIVIAKSLTIDASALPKPITLSGDKTGNGKTPDDTRVFRIYDSVVILDSLIISGGTNSSDSYGGGAINAIGHSVKLTINCCSFSQNHAYPEGGAIYFYGAYQAPETALIIRSSTFSGNTSTQSGGAIFAFGVVDILNSTITGNSASQGGGIYIFFNSPSLIESATITGNTATTGGGGVFNSGSLDLRNTIVAGNTAPVSPNLSGVFTGSFNLTSGNPLLAPLGDYGGPTLTMLPLPVSPVINAGGPTSLTTDQRGFPRVSTPDIGAVEYPSPVDFASFWKLDSDGDGSPYGTEQALGTDPSVADSAHSRNLTAPALNASGHAILSFGLTSTPAPGTVWILKRSVDLSPGSFMEIYRYNGTKDSAASGIIFLRTATSITVTDKSPPPGRVFYRFEALLDP